MQKGTGRRKFLIGAGALGGLALGALGYGAYRLQHPALVPLGFDFSDEELARARDFLKRNLVIDSHAHPGRGFLDGAEHLSGRLRLAQLMGSFEERTIADMEAGGLTGSIFAAVGDLQTLGFTGEGLSAIRQFEPGEAWASYRRQIAHLSSLAKKGLVHSVLRADDFAAAKRAGKIGALLAVEGGDFLEGKPQRVAQAWDDGVRLIGLMHYRANELGDIITGTPVHGGLTKAGEDVVHAMNEKGMLIDVAHASEDTVRGILAASTLPVIASHVHIKTPQLDHPRFISRDLARAIAAAGGGVIGAWPAGIGLSTLKGFVERTSELIDAVGIDHVCLGSDMDANYKPVFDSYTRLPHYVAGLMRAGLDEDALQKLMGGNFLRLMRENQNPSVSKAVSEANPQAGT